MSGNDRWWLRAGAKDDTSPWSRDEWNAIVQRRTTEQVAEAERLKEPPMDDARRMEIERQENLAQRYKSLVADAGPRGLLVTMTLTQYADLVDPAICHYCGCSIGPTHYGIDRKDPGRGYEKDNVVACCAGCNKAKQAFPYAVWKAIADAFVDQHGRGKMWPVPPIRSSPERRQRMDDAKLAVGLARGLKALAMWAIAVEQRRIQVATREWRERNRTQRAPLTADDIAARKERKRRQDASYYQRDKRERAIAQGRVVEAIPAVRHGKGFEWRGRWRPG
jgi:hypothetical protein